MTCERCGRETSVHVCSMFSTEELCLDCCRKEREHPGYQRARDAEAAAVRAGNLNYRGIGKPQDL